MAAARIICCWMRPIGSSVSSGSIEQIGDRHYLRIDRQVDSEGQWETLIERGTNIPTRFTIEAIVHGPGPLPIIFGEWSDKPTEVDRLAVVTCTLPSGERLLVIDTLIDANGTVHLSIMDRTGGGQRTILGNEAYANPLAQHFSVQVLVTGLHDG